MFHQQDASGGLGLLGHAQSPVARFLLLTFLNRAVFGSQDASHARVDNIALVLSPLPIMARTAWDPPTLSEAFVQILRWQALSFVVSCFLKSFSLHHQSAQACPTEKPGPRTLEPTGRTAPTVPSTDTPGIFVIVMYCLQISIGNCRDSDINPSDGRV